MAGNIFKRFKKKTDAEKEIDDFRRREVAYREQQRIYEQQYKQMDNNLNIWDKRYSHSYQQNYTQNELSDKAREEALKLALMNQQIPEPPKLTKEEERRRNIALGARCPRCDIGKLDCWECSGTGITPIPWAEVMSGERRGASASDEEFNMKLAQMLPLMKAKQSPLSQSQYNSTSTFKSWRTK